MAEAPAVLSERHARHLPSAVNDSGGDDLRPAVSVVQKGGCAQSQLRQQDLVYDADPEADEREEGRF